MTEISLAELADAGQLNARDLDTIYVAFGRISRAAVQSFVEGKRPGPTQLPLVASELTERICGCQHHDGGRTELVSVTDERVHLRVAGACVHCPQIKYTMRILADAIRFRSPDVDEVRIDGTDFDTRTEIPPGSQITMPMLMRKSGMTFRDLDEELDRNPELTDDHLVRLAQRCLLRTRRGR